MRSAVRGERLDGRMMMTSSSRAVDDDGVSGDGPIRTNYLSFSDHHQMNQNRASRPARAGDGRGSRNTTNRGVHSNYDDWRHDGGNRNNASHLPNDNEDPLLLLATSRRPERGAFVAGDSQNHVDDPVGTTTTTTTTTARSTYRSQVYHSMHTDHRGFSTSIHDMFATPDFERVDCCAMTCCGILQSDRDRFLLTGIPPPGCCKRLYMHVMLPVAIFLAAGYSATHIQQVDLNQAVSTGLILVLILYFVTQCWKGRSKRIEVRKDLLYTKYQIQQDTNSNAHPVQSRNLAVLLDQERPQDDHDGQDRVYYLGQSRRDFACAHPCCLVGLYGEDRPLLPVAAISDDDDAEDLSSVIPKSYYQSLRQANQRKLNLCSCLWDWICIPWCGMHVQCCGVCAIAQEAREIESYVLPASYRRIDYITMQPFMDYYPLIYRVKYRKQIEQQLLPWQQPSATQTSDAAAITTTVSSETGRSSNTPLSALSTTHEGEPERYLLDDDESMIQRSSLCCGCPPLSRLSIRILQVCTFLLLLLLAWSFLGPLYWTKVVGRSASQQHHDVFALPDLGIFVLEMVVCVAFLALLVTLTNQQWTGGINSGLSTDAIIKYFCAGFCIATMIAVFWEVVLGLLVRIAVSFFLAMAGVDEVADEDGYSHSAFSYDSLLNTVVRTFHFQYFGGAANISGRPASYGTYVFPTLLLSTDSTSARGDSDSFLEVYGKSHPLFYTVYILVSTFFLAACIEELCKYFTFRMVDHPDFMSQQDLRDASLTLHGEVDSDSEEGRQRHQSNGSYRMNTNRHEDFTFQRKSAQAHGAAITLAMLSVAMGFTCCENLVYIFIYSGSSVDLKMSVLIARALFPVHPLAAALQSIGVCERDIERKRKTQLGKIVFAAVLFHGMYDFMIVWIDYWVKRKGVYDSEGSEQMIAIAAFCSLAASVLAMFFALVYFLSKASQQRQRLAAMDRQIAVVQSNLLL